VAHLPNTIRETHFGGRKNSKKYFLRSTILQGLKFKIELPQCWLHSTGTFITGTVVTNVDGLDEKDDMVNLGLERPVVPHTWIGGQGLHHHQIALHLSGSTSHTLCAHNLGCQAHKSDHAMACHKRRQKACQRMNQPAMTA
jgi:hypothetical protein